MPVKRVKGKSHDHKDKQDFYEKPIKSKSKPTSGNFHIEFKNEAQSLAWAAFKQHDVLFMVGPAGTGKTHLACAFAIEQLLARDSKKERIILTRPIVEAGESLGFLPGEFEEKVEPYMMPMYDCIDKSVGKEGAWRDRVNQAIEVAPIAFMRGRAQPLDAKIMTPSGYRKMGEIQVGDEVIGSNGFAVKVLGVYPQGDKEVYNVSFSDGSSVEACEDHLWATSTLSERRHKKGFTVKSTKEIKKTLKNKHNQKNHCIPLCEPIQFQENKSPAFDPYLIGSLLGDGSLHELASITFSSGDQEMFVNISDSVGDELKISMAKSESSDRAPCCRIVPRDRAKKRNSLKAYLAQNGLLGMKSHQKFIPEELLYGSIETRIALLRGLMDTDGSIFFHRSGKSRVQYYSTSQALAEGVRFLAHSLGGTASIRKREFKEGDSHEFKGREIVHRFPLYVVDLTMGDINPFKLKRKSEKFDSCNPRRLIAAIDLVGKKPCQCIRVDADDSLYLTDHCVVTHNTFNNAVCIFDEAQNASLLQLKLFLTRFGEDSKIIITGDPTQSDLVGKVALVEVMNKLHGVPGIGVVEFKSNSIVRHPLVGAILEKLQ
jgi:phosphate starvation-inducible protein PhoH and related proteins